MPPSERVATLPIVKTWGDLLNQPPVNIGNGVTVRLGIKTARLAKGNGALVYCLTEGYDPSTKGIATLGPLRISVKHEPLKGYREQMALLIHPAMPLLDYSKFPPNDGKLLFSYRIVGYSAGHCVISCCTTSGQTMATATIEVTDDAFHPWLMWSPYEWQRYHRPRADDKFGGEFKVAFVGKPVGEVALPRWQQIAPIAFDGTMDGVQIRHARNEPLPRLVPDQADKHLMLRAVRNILIVTSDTDFITSNPAEHFIARWWVNGKPFVPVNNEEPRQMSAESGRMTTARELRIIMPEFDPAALGAKHGDTIGLQLLYSESGCSGLGYEEQSLSTTFPANPSQLIRVSNRAEFAAAALRKQSEMEWIVQPVPSGAGVTLVFDKQAYFLGENILAHYCLENTGARPFGIDVGSDYRFATRALRYQVIATDAAGNEAPDPDPSGYCGGGKSAGGEIKPQGKWYGSLPLMRYCQIDKPGVYTVRAEHDLGWLDIGDDPIPSGTATVKLLMPDENQARQIVDDMYRLPDNNGWTYGEKREPYADFTTLRYPVYLPILLERAQNGDKQALTGITSIETPEATQALIGLLAHKNPQVATEAGRALNGRLPDPEWRGELPPRSSPFKDPWLERRRKLCEKTWRPEFAAAVHPYALKFLAGNNAECETTGAFMLECIGQNEDFPEIIVALDRAIARTESIPREANVHPRPSGSCRELLRAVEIMLRHGAEAPAAPKSPAEALAFFSAIKASPDFRPDGWEKQYELYLQHPLGYMRLGALEHLPSPLPQSVINLLEKLLFDPDVDVQILVCNTIRENKLIQFCDSILKVLATAKDEQVLHAANNAAYALGAGFETWSIWISRLDESGMENIALNALIEHLGFGYGRKGPGPIAPATARALKVRWTQFFDEYQASLKEHRQFKIGDPEVTSDLFPKDLKFYINNTTWP